VSSPLVSCLLPTARRPEWARQVCRMIAEQTYKNLELVIVNSGEPISGLPPFAREIPARVKGFPEQNAQTMLEARGDIMVYLDDDDYYAPDRVARQVEPILAGRATVTGVKMYYYVEVPAMRWYHHPPSKPAPGSPQGWSVPFFEGSGCFHRSVLRHFTQRELTRIWRSPFINKLKAAGEPIEVLPNKNAVVRVQHGSGSSGAPQCFSRDLSKWIATKAPPEIPAYVIDFWKRGGRMEAS
jgi:glycosyltransferase involved in cell wall biosynthesis